MGVFINPVDTISTLQKPLSMFNSLKSKLYIPSLRIVVISMIAVVLMLIIFILTLPSIVSTNWFRGVILSTVNNTVNLPVSINKVTWQWKDGITVSGVTIENDPLFSDHPLFSLESVGLRIHLKDILSGRINVDFLADNIQLVIIQDKSGKKNIESLYPIPQPADLKKNESEENVSPGLDPLNFSLSLPVDIQCDVKLENISILFINQRDNQKISLRSGNVAISMPSMFFQPVTMGVSGDLRLNDGEILPFNFNSLIENRQISSKTYTPADTSLRIQGDVPGVNILIDGDLLDKGIKGSVKVDLDPIADLAAPFLPANISSSKFSGGIILTVDAAMKTDRNIAFNVQIQADRILISGPLVHNRDLMPFNTSLDLKGKFILDTGDLEIQPGRIQILANSSIEFKGRVNKLTGRPPDADVSVGPIFIDIEEINNFIKPLVPDDLGAEYTFKNGRPQLRIQQFRFRGNPMTGSGRVNLAGLSMSVPGVHLSSNDLEINASQIVLTLLDAETRLKEYFPEQAGISVLTVSLPEVVLDDPSVGHIKTAANLALKLPVITVYNIDPISADIHNADIAVILGDLVRLNMTADAKNLAASDLTAEGRIMINLGNLSKYVPEPLLKGVHLSGACGINWDIQGRMPYPDEMNRLSGKGIPDLKEDLAFIDHIDATINLFDTTLDMSLSETENVRIGDLSATPLVHYIFKNGNGELKTHVNVGEILEVPGIVFHTPVSAEIRMTAVHDDLNRVTVFQEVTSGDLNLKETLSAEVSEIKNILKKKPENPIAELLKAAGVSIQSKVQLSDCSVLNRFQNDVTVNGALDLDTSLKLVPGESISAGFSTAVHHTSLNMENLVSLKDLNGKLNFHKSYAVSTPQQSALNIRENADRSSDLLSLRVMQSGRYHGRHLQSNPVLMAESIEETRFNPDQTLTFSSLKSDAGPVPVTLSGFMAEMGLNQGLPELKRFQVDLLHGTIAGEASVFKKKDLFFSYMSINFTGIDLAAFFPKSDMKGSTEDTEVGGRLTLYLPVSTQLNAFLDNLDMDLFFSHIGARAIERLFYAIDPYETNEAIVTYRRILKTGSPRFLRVQVKDGHLSMVGEINVKGAEIEPLKMDKPINITSLSGFNKLKDMLDELAPVIEMLQMASAGTIMVSNELEFK